MSEQTSNPGTPTDKTTDAPDTGVSESVESEVREAAEDEQQKQDRKDWKAEAIAARQEALGLKERLQELNRREQERQPEPGSYTSPTDARMAQTQADIARLQAAYLTAQQGAAAGDDRDYLLLKMLEDQLTMKQESLIRQQLDRIPADRRERVWDHFQKNRHRFITIDAADDSLYADEYRNSRSALEQKQKDAEAVLRAKEQGAQGTHGSREVGAAEAKVRKMTAEQFDDEIGRLRAEGKDAEAHRLMGLVRQRKVLLTG